MNMAFLILHDTYCTAAGWPEEVTSLLTFGLFTDLVV